MSAATSHLMEIRIKNNRPVLVFPEHREGLLFRKPKELSLPWLGKEKAGKTSEFILGRKVGSDKAVLRSGKAGTKIEIGERLRAEVFGLTGNQRSEVEGIGDFKDVSQEHCQLTFQQQGEVTRVFIEDGSWADGKYKQSSNGTWVLKTAGKGQESAGSVQPVVEPLVVEKPPQPQTAEKPVFLERKTEQRNVKNCFSKRSQK